MREKEDSCAQIAPGYFPDKESTSWPNLRGCGHLRVNVPAEDQLELCKAFARSRGDTFPGVEHGLSKCGMPVLDDVVAHIECVIEDEIDAGDRTIVLGRLQDLQAHRVPGPLPFFKGQYGKFTRTAW